MTFMDRGKSHEDICDCGIDPDRHGCRRVCAGQRAVRPTAGEQQQQKLLDQLKSQQQLSKPQSKQMSAKQKEISQKMQQLKQEQPRQEEEEVGAINRWNSKGTMYI